MKKDFTVVFVSPEMMIPEFSEPACGANFRGGLGILAGDIMEGLAKRKIKAMGIVPFYHRHWRTREEISYDNVSSQYFFELRPGNNGRRKSIKIRRIDRGGTEVFGIECPEIFNILYTADRWQRIQQEALLAYTVPVLFKKLNIKPDIIWLQEGHTAAVIPLVKEDSYFNGVKFLFTTHTPVPEGMEKFYEAWFDELGINREKYQSIFVKDGLIDMTKAAMILSDRVTAVSEEHSNVTKRMFPEFSEKIVGIRNGSSRELWFSPRIKRLGGNPDLFKLWEAHKADKAEFVGFINQELEKRKIEGDFDLQKPIVVWVRRIAWYKQQHPMLVPVIRAICAERNEVIETSFGKLQGLGIQIFSAGRAHENDSQCLGWMSDFERWMREPCLKGKFVFLPEYNFNLLKVAAHGCDIWFSCPLPEWEACGTSDQRSAINGNPNLTTKAGGAAEYIEEYNPATGRGNGFLIEPYEPITVYNKLKIISDLYYSWIEKGDMRWPNLRMNVFKAAKKLDILRMIKEYEKIFKKLLN